MICAKDKLIRAKDKLQRFPGEPRGLIPSLLSVSTPPPFLHSDLLLRPGTRIPSRGGHPFPVAQTVRPVTSQGLLGPYPLLPHAVPIPRQPEMPSCRGKQPQQPYLSLGGGWSLLGAVPVVPLRTPRKTFLLECHHEPRGPFMNKEGSLHTFQRKRQNKLVAEEKSNGQISKFRTDIKKEEKKLEASVGNQGSSTEQAEPPGKKQKNHGAAELLEKCEDESAEQKSADSSTVREQEVYMHAYEEEEYPSAEADKEVEQSRTAEVGVGTSLKVTIQCSSESRAFSSGSAEAAAASGPAMDKDMNLTANKYSCYICNVTSLHQYDFQIHMISLGHQQKIMEIQNLSNTCLATLLPKMHQSLQGKHRGLQRWCAVCQFRFTGDLIEHRRTKKHKMAKVSSRPFCTVCEQHFRTPRKFVEHMKSPEHKQQVEELKEGGGPEVMEELITLDAIGCFEDEDEYEEDVSEDKEAPTVLEQINLVEINDDGEYDPDTQYGTSFVAPVAGFLCKLCHRFYHFESRARETHCKSFTHLQNLQKYKAMLNLLQEEDDENPASPLGNVQNVKNSSVITEEMKERHEEEDENQLDFITNPPAGHTKKKHSQSLHKSPTSKLLPKSSATQNPTVVFNCSTAENIFVDCSCSTQKRKSKETSKSQ